jgi:hypothetical protein
MIRALDEVVNGHHRGFREAGIIAINRPSFATATALLVRHPMMPAQVKSRRQ